VEKLKGGVVSNDMAQVVDVVRKIAGMPKNSNSAT
jgi:hypothetical protein